MKKFIFMTLVVSLFAPVRAAFFSFGGAADWIAQGFSVRYIGRVAGVQLYGRYSTAHGIEQTSAARLIKMFRLDRRLRPYLGLTFGAETSGLRLENVSTAASFGVDMLIIPSRPDNATRGLSLNIEASMGFLGHSNYGGPFAGAGFHYNF